MIDSQAQKGSVISDALTYSARHSPGKEMEKYGADEQITSFRRTFLSNFAAVPVVYNGKKYESVERAYQRAKFTEGDLNAVSDEARAEIEHYLRLRGYSVDTFDINSIFAGQSFSSSEAKEVADILRSHGYQRDDWDDVRVPIMADLLIQKFTQEPYRSELLATGTKLLVEGNTWDDTFWGFSNDRGRNMLGSLLMVVRDRLANGELGNT